MGIKKFKIISKFPKNISPINGKTIIGLIVKILLGIFNDLNNILWIRRTKALPVKSKSI